jgi:hypothetical protein
MKARAWHYLDPLNQIHGPVSDAQLERVLSLGDCYVWTDGMPAWQAASEALAREGVAPLPHQSTKPAIDPGAEVWLSRRRMDRCLHELLGICRGLVADGILHDLEAQALRAWLRGNPDIADHWPASTLAERLEAIFQDGTIDAGERRSLLDLLGGLTGGHPPTPGGRARSIALPLCDPPPPLVFPERVYVLTGEFIFGDRSACEAATRAAGARVASSVSRKTSVLVVGAIASESWVHGVFGRKIEAGVALRNQGAPISIVSEEWWTLALPDRAKRRAPR